MSHIKMFEKFQDDDRFASNNAYIANLMQEDVKQYHKSYDALIPVFRKVEELRDVSGEDYYTEDDSEVMDELELERMRETDPDGEIYGDDYDNSPVREYLDRDDIGIKFEEIFDDAVYDRGSGIPEVEDLYELIIDFLSWYSQLQKDD